MISENDIIKILNKIQEHPDYDYGLSRNQLRKYAKEIISKLPKLEFYTKCDLKFNPQKHTVTGFDAILKSIGVGFYKIYKDKNIKIYVEIIDE